MNFKTLLVILLLVTCMALVVFFVSLYSNKEYDYLVSYNWEIDGKNGSANMYLTRSAAICDFSQVLLVVDYIKKAEKLAKVVILNYKLVNYRRVLPWKNGRGECGE